MASTGVLNSTVVKLYGQDAGGAKTFTSPNVNTTTDEITITSHGFGANGTDISARLTTTGTAPAGMTAGSVYTFDIVDANTIDIKGVDITDGGSGTHTLTPLNAIALGTDASFSGSTDERDITTKDSSGVFEFLPGLQNYSFSVGALFAEDAAFGYNDLLTAFLAKTSLVLKLSSEVSGDEYEEGTCYITSLEKSSPDVEQNAVYSATFKVTSTVTNGTVPA